MDNKKENTLTEVEQAVKSINKDIAAQTSQLAPKMDMEPLNDEELKQIEDYAASIDIHNTSTVISYGASAQRKVAEFSESALGNVTAKDLGAVGDALTSVITELKGFEIDKDDKGFFSFFRRSAKKGANKVMALKTSYEKAEANIERVVQVLEKHQVTLLKDVAMLDKLYELNKGYFRELTMYIEAGKKKLASIQDNELHNLRAKAQESKLPEDAQARSEEHTSELQSRLPT